MLKMSSVILMVMGHCPEGQFSPTELSSLQASIFNIRICFLLENTEQVETKLCKLTMSRLHLYPRTLLWFRPSQYQYITPTFTDIFWSPTLCFCLKEKIEDSLHWQLYSIPALLIAITVGIKDLLNLCLDKTARKPRE